MPSGWGKTTRLNMQKYITNNSPAAAPTTWFLALSTTDPLDDASGLGEPSATGGYARKAITWAVPAAGANDASVPAVSVTTAQTFGPSSAAYSTGATALSFWAIFDAVTAGNFLARGALSVPQAVNAAGVTITVPAGNITLNLITS
jgi:hypothetical protein